ncbi:hypothetical protein [Celerinatantimonas sp. MCCC 1A17872]|uniref:hypothetical protein n=1 Tax=Celerinatantimonas sp. MCCC 1A17872 TaxID=3177514 RepID=UPI0038BE7FC0
MFSMNHKMYLFPLRILKQLFNDDGYDNAGDQILQCLTSACQHNAKVSTRFHFDTSHANQWFHYLGLSVSGLNSSQQQRFERALNKAGFIYSN